MNFKCGDTECVRSSLTCAGDRLKGQGPGLARDRDRLRGQGPSLARDGDRLRGQGPGLARDRGRLRGQGPSLARDEDRLGFRQDPVFGGVHDVRTLQSIPLSLSTAGVPFAC